MSGTSEVAVLGGGCFWCLEAVFEKVPGVTNVVSGYSGGEMKNPTYGDVCSGETGHIEVVRIEFDPGITSYSGILDMFWRIHDPTSLDRQGADTGSQYRSVIFYANEAQKIVAEKSILEIAKALSDPVVTELRPIEPFWQAEFYHQDYFARNPDDGYCRIVIAPKLKKAGF